MAIAVQEEEVQSCPSGAGLGPRLCLAPSVAFSRAALGLNCVLSVGLEGLPEAAVGPPPAPPYSVGLAAEMQSLELVLGQAAPASPVVPEQP